jgi:ferredoxin-NADP reductase
MSQSQNLNLLPFLLHRAFCSVNLSSSRFSLISLQFTQTYPKGNLSQYFAQLKIGDTIEAKGPKGQMKYYPGYCAQIGMIAGGTGITPMLVSPLHHSLPRRQV